MHTHTYTRTGSTIRFSQSMASCQRHIVILICNNALAMSTFSCASPPFFSYPFQYTSKMKCLDAVRANCATDISSSLSMRYEMHLCIVSIFSFQCLLSRDELCVQFAVFSLWNVYKFKVQSKFSVRFIFLNCVRPVSSIIFSISHTHDFPLSLSFPPYRYQSVCPSVHNAVMILMMPIFFSMSIFHSLFSLLCSLLFFPMEWGETKRNATI